MDFPCLTIERGYNDIPPPLPSQDWQANCFMQCGMYWNVFGAGTLPSPYVESVIGRIHPYISVQAHSAHVTHLPIF